MSRNAVLVTGGFDDLGVRQVRFLQEASRWGDVVVLLWTDQAMASALGSLPRFSLRERLYLLASLRFVARVRAVDDWHTPWRFAGELPDAVVVCTEARSTGPEGEAAVKASASLGVPLRTLSGRELEGFPEAASVEPDASKRRVVVTGCYDWLHSGHVRFFEEASALGELYVVVGHDANVRLLKGEGHPRFPQEQRRYMTGAVRYVYRSLVSSGSGWMDAEPEMATIGAHIYAVNEDGDKPEKRDFCRAHGIDYVVLKRTPAPGLPRRSSTDLRGF